jgi:hypothetical protein
VCVRKAEVQSARAAGRRLLMKDMEHRVLVLLRQNAQLEKDVARLTCPDRDQSAALGRRVKERATRHLEATWRSQDGREIRVQAMSQAHLLYALAKAERGEYGARSFAGNRVGALESELLRRLAGVAGTERQQAAHDLLEAGY